MLATFSCLDLKSGFWQIRMDEASKQYTAFTVGNLGFFKCDRMPFGLCNMPSYLPMAYAELYGRVELCVLLNLPGQLDHVLMYYRRTLALTMCGLQLP